jgi:hypothetical protein
MRPAVRLLALVMSLLVALATPAGAAAAPSGVATHTWTKNMKPLGEALSPVPLANATPGAGVFNSDLAFWGQRAYQGTYNGFNIIDIADPENPVKVLDYNECAPNNPTTGNPSTAGNQGDVVVWGGQESSVKQASLLIRAWNSNATGQSCGGDPLPDSFEGLNIFDLGDELNPDHIGFVDLPNGSHTLTLVPDLEHDRLLVYVSASGGETGIQIVEVPLADPGAASPIHFEPSGIGTQPNFVTIDAPSSAAGSYGASGAAFGPAPTLAGTSGDVVLVDDGVAVEAGATVNDGCEPYTVPAGSLALVDRGFCGFVVKAAIAQAAGAAGLIVANNAAGAPITMGGTDPSIVIPAVMVSQTDGAVIKAGLPATGTISANPTPSRSCHDTGVILGDVQLAGCAGGNGFTVWSLDPADGGSLEDPALLYSRVVPGVSVGHSASFSWDGEVLIFGHEPGGGSQAQCQETSSETNRSLFFFDARTGDPLGTFVHPRPQTNLENCTWHNYNAVPTDKGYVLVSGSYQSGVSVIDFTNPASATEIGYADPAPLVNPDNAAAIELGGDWSTYWYDGRIYESDISRGLFVWNLTDSAVAGAMKLGHSNPQTQEVSIP